MELGVPWKRADPALKKICWQMMTEQVHMLKFIMQREKQTNTYPGWTKMHVHSFSSLISSASTFHIRYSQK